MTLGEKRVWEAAASELGDILSHLYEPPGSLDKFNIDLLKLCNTFQQRSGVVGHRTVKFEIAIERFEAHIKSLEFKRTKETP